MEDELWMRKIKERLDDYSEPLPASGWERLEKDLMSASQPPVTEKRRVVPFRRRAVAAAAVLLVAVSSVSLWLLQSPVGDEVRTVAVPSLAVIPDRLPESQLPDVQAKLPEASVRGEEKVAQTAVFRRSLMAQQISVAEDETETFAIREEETSAIWKEEATAVRKEEATSVREEVAASKNEKGKETEPVRRRPSGKDKLFLPVEKKHTKSHGWSVGLSVGNTGGLSLGNNLSGGAGMQNSPSDGFGGRIDLTSTANGILSIPEGEELVFKDGLPYLRKRADRIASIEHKQPLSFGFSVRKGLAKGFSVETGLTYTYLASDVRFEGSSEEMSQKLHYIGIPLRANWNFIDKKSFTMYISAGGAVEKCVYGKVGSKDETVKPLQFSVMGAVGAQYNISNRVGLYVEPGVAYFFDDGAAVQTIRKENPCNFTLQGGIRLTY